MTGPRDDEQPAQLGFDDLDPTDDAPFDDEDAFEAAIEAELEYIEDEATTETDEPPPRRRRQPPPAWEDDWDDDDLPAPVVTHEGVYGTLPRPSRTLRDYQYRERGARETWSRVAGILFALIAATWLGLYSISQATSETVALPAISRTVETLTSLSQLLVLQEEAIRESTDDPHTVFGFEVTGVTLSREEISDGNPATWHTLLLDRTAQAIYTEGPGVLSLTGTQEGAGTFSTPGGARRLMTTLSESNHTLASALLYPLAIAALVTLAATFVLGTAFARFQTVGFALLVAATPTIVLAVLAIGFLNFVIGTDGSALATQTHQIASDIARTPLRNGLTVFVAGLLIAIPARILGAVFGSSASTVTDED